MHVLTCEFPGRSSEYYGGETNPPDGNLFHRTGVSGTYESPAAPQPDPLKVEHSEVGRANQYSFPSSEPGYNYENAQPLNVEFSQPQTSSPVQNLAPFNAMVSMIDTFSSEMICAAWISYLSAREVIFNNTPKP